MGGSNSKKSNANQQERQTMTNTVWRPVTTRATSVQGGSSSQVQKPSCSQSTSITGTQHVKNKGLELNPVVSTKKHSVSVNVGSSVIRFIRGKDGSTQKQIEEETGVKIKFPLSRTDDSIIIESGSIDSATRAAEKIQMIIDEAVKSPSLDYSHFVSLPLAIHPALVDKLFNFQNSILGEDAGQQSELGIEKSIFINPRTFHLTVLMLKLWNKDRVNTATEVLKSISTKVRDALDNRPVFVKLKGLDLMRGSIAKAGVVYARVEVDGGEDRLLHACPFLEIITDAFVEAGLVMEKDAKQKLKLHATVMNGRFRKSKQRSKRNDSFDARGIFEKFGSEEWGSYHIREAHLSQRFKYDESGYYHCCASIPFPESKQVD
ncbi:hypothetical protein ACFE04_003936 [Oxalis oulophora]